MRKYKRKLFRAALALILLQTSSFGVTIKYLLASATGAGTGNSWTDAYTTTSAAETGTPRDGLCYTGDGGYAGGIFNTATSGSLTIEFRKATIADHGTETGWSDTFGDGVATFSGHWNVDSGFWIFDGKTGGGPGSWYSSFGFHITETGGTSSVIENGELTAASNNIYRHIRATGMNNGNSGGGGDGNDGIEIVDDTNITISYCWFEKVGRCPWFFPPNVGTVIVEFCSVDRFWADDNPHGETASIDTAQGNVTFRYNLIQWSTSTGGIQWGDDEDGSPDFPDAILEVYGNVFDFLSSETAGNGTVVGTWTAGIMHNVYFHNNTIINAPSAVFYPGNGDAVNLNASNNLFYNCDSPGYDDFNSHDYNHYINSGGAHSESNGTTAASGDPFVDFANNDYALVSDTAPADTTIATRFRTDMFGNVGDTRGAVQFDSEGGTSGGGGGFSGSISGNSKFSGNAGLVRQ